MHVFLLDCLPFIISLSYSRQLFSAFDSVSAFCFRRSSISAFGISLPCFQFIALASIILQRSRSCRLHSSSPTSVRSRHPNNMSPIMTFLVSGILLLSRSRGDGFYPGVPRHGPRTSHGRL